MSIWRWACVCVQQGRVACPSSARAWQKVWLRPCLQHLRRKHRHFIAIWLVCFPIVAWCHTAPLWHGCSTALSFSLIRSATMCIPGTLSISHRFNNASLKLTWLLAIGTARVAQRTFSISAVDGRQGLPIFPVKSYLIKMKFNLVKCAAK